MILIFNMHEHLARLASVTDRPERLLLQLVGYHLYREYHLQTNHTWIGQSDRYHYPKFQLGLRIELQLVGSAVVRGGAREGHLHIHNTDLWVTLETTRIGAHAAFRQIPTHHHKRLGRRSHGPTAPLSAYPT